MASLFKKKKRRRRPQNGAPVRQLQQNGGVSRAEQADDPPINRQQVPAEHEAGEVAAYRRRMSWRKVKRLIRLGIAVLVIGLAAFLTVFLFQRQSYDDYKVLDASEQEDTVSSQYTELDGKLFKYSGEGASLVNSKQETLWNAAYEKMENPSIDICGNTAVVYDQDNSSMVIFNEGGQLGSVSTDLAIVKARVAEQGVVAAILDGGEDTWVNFYASDGSLIAENQTRVDDPGYPLDVSVSPDGMMIMVTYQFVDGGETTSYVAFYNFGSVGQNQIDNIVSGYKYEGVVIPKVEYLNDGTAVAFRDDGFTIYQGKQVPKEAETVKVEKEIISAFCDSKRIGLVFKNDSEGSKDKQYVMRMYNTGGRVEFTKEFGIPYTDIKLSGGQVVMYNSSQVCVISDSGVEKFNGNIDEGVINNFFKLGMNRYILVLDSGLSTIKFS